MFITGPALVNKFKIFNPNIYQGRFGKAASLAQKPDLPHANFLIRNFLHKPMKKTNLFREIYTLDQDTNRYMIEIALDQYADIFDEWDPAPFKRRSIDPDLELYLEGSSEEIPLRYPVELCFMLPAERRDEKLEEETRHGLKNSFAFRRYLLEREQRKTIAQIMRCIILGFAFLWFGSVFSARHAGQELLSLLAEALYIGGWVFLWEAVSLFFFTERELYYRYRSYKRWQNALVIFREMEKTGNFD